MYIYIYSYPTAKMVTAKKKKMDQSMGTAKKEAKKTSAENQSAKTTAETESAKKDKKTKNKTTAEKQ